MIRCDVNIDRLSSTSSHHPLLLSHLIDLQLKYLLLQNELHTHQAFLGIKTNGDVNLIFDKILITLTMFDGRKKLIVAIIR